MGCTQDRRRTIEIGFRRIRRRGDPGIAAFDFFPVPSGTFKLLYRFFVIEHGRRKILHFNITYHPTAEWVAQPSREDFPGAGPYRYAIFDRDSKFDTDVISFLKATGLKPKQTSAPAADSS